MMRKSYSTIYINPSVIINKLVIIDSSSEIILKKNNPIVINRRQLTTVPPHNNNNNNNIKSKIITTTTNQTNNVSNSKTTPIKLPNATWSIASLELNKNHKPISMEELQVLAKRAIIDLNTINQPTDQLRQDIGNMMNMINQVVQKTTAINDSSSSNSSSMEQQYTVEELYDKPRGVISAPYFNNNTITSEQQQALQKESTMIWKNYLKPKMKPKGSHNYFVLATSISSSNNDEQQKTTKSTKKQSTTKLDDDDQLY